LTSSPKKAFKIKVLPKKGDPQPKVEAPRSAPEASSSPSSPLGAILLVVAVFAAIGLYYVQSGGSKQAPKVATPKAPEKSSVVVRPEDKKLTQFLQDSQRKKELLNMRVQVENSEASLEGLPDYVDPRFQDRAVLRPMGVELDSDPSMDRIYEDLYGGNRSTTSVSPEDRISAQLAQKKWLYKFELEERKMYIQNFIAAAKEAGYDIKVDENLIVTQVIPLTTRPKVPLDKVLEDLDR